MNEEKNIKDILNEEKVPEEISPENIKTMLDEQTAADTKRKGISQTAKMAISSAACLLIIGGAVAAGAIANPGRNVKPDMNEPAATTASSGETTTTAAEETTAPGSVTTTRTEVTKTDKKAAKSTSYLTAAKDYSEVYEIFSKSFGEYMDDLGRQRKYGALQENGIEYTDEEADYAAPESSAVNGVGGSTAAADAPDYYDTYNQEEGVLEADICKTDGRFIYYITTEYVPDKTICKLNYAEVENGNFINSGSIDIFPEMPENVELLQSAMSIDDMYLYNGMVIMVGTAYGVNEAVGYSQTMSFVTAYTAGGEPEYIGTYFQDGWYSDVRIAPDGYMYLCTNYSSDYFESLDDEEDIEHYIPSCGCERVNCLPAEEIFMPEEPDQGYGFINYTVIGSIDLNNGYFENVQTKAMAGFSGNIYMSQDNIYLAKGYDETTVTRVAVSGGNIEPACSAAVEGHVKDQFSMSEYDGCFRIATTVEDWDKYGIVGDAFGIDGYTADNYVYVFDLDLTELGHIHDFGRDETIKSVNFRGDMAYVVTYEQTDPLFAIDLSDPSSPEILDELKINGYSTYMQKWSDDLLLGFGVNADDNGFETGIKVTMFDNSDPTDLKAAATYTLDRSDDYSWLYSEGVWDRKAVMIAPEKEIVGFPINYSRINDDDWEYRVEYDFLRYDEQSQEFVPVGAIKGGEQNESSSSFRRAVYVGDYVYVLSGESFIAADLDTITQTDIAYFPAG